MTTGVEFKPMGRVAGASILARRPSCGWYEIEAHLRTPEGVLVVARERCPAGTNLSFKAMVLLAVRAVYDKYLDHCMSNQGKDVVYELDSL
jgi:hypothetical protein